MSKYKLTILLAVLLATACATSPTGRRQLMLVSEQQAIAASREAYVQALAPLEQEGKLNADPAQVRRIEEITGRLIAQAIRMRPETEGWEWSINVIEAPDTVNAWCMAGGKMAIYTGMFDKLEATDDELAQVMGHEIGHALANHTAEKMSVSLATTLGVVAVGSIVNENRRAAMSGAAAAAALAVTLPNSRTAETESDRIGIELAARAGYDPRAAITLWQKMAEVGGSRGPQFLSTHPGPENRQAKLAALVPQMMPYYQDRSPRPVYPL